MKKTICFFAAVLCVIVILISCTKKETVSGPSAAGKPNPEATAVPTNSGPSRIFTTGFSDHFTNMGILADGSVIMGGYRTNPAPVYDTIYLTKIDANGNKLWEHEFADGQVENIVITPSGGAVVAAYSNNLDLFCIDTSGNALWAKSYNYLDPISEVYAVMADSGGYFVAGNAEYGETTVMQIDSGGDCVWAKCYPNNLYLRDDKINTDSAGNINIIGNDFTTTGGDDMVVINTDPSGNTRWTNTYGTPASELCGNLESAGPDTIACAVTRENTLGDILLFKFNSAGTQIKSVLIGDPAAEAYSCNIIPVGSGNYFVLSSSTDCAPGYVYNTILGLAKVDGNLNVLWTKYYWCGASGYTQSKIYASNDGNFIVGGSIQNTAAANSQFFLMKLDENGNRIW